METITVNVVVIPFGTSQEAIKEVYDSITEETANKRCFHVNESTFIKKVDGSEFDEEIDFFFYAWRNEGEKVELPDSLMGEFIGQSAEGGYSSITLNGVYYEAMWHCAEF